jgi:hypothetical protein
MQNKTYNTPTSEDICLLAIKWINCKTWWNKKSEPGSDLRVFLSDAIEFRRLASCPSNGVNGVEETLVQAKNSLKRPMTTRVGSSEARRKLI